MSDRLARYGRAAEGLYGYLSSQMRPSQGYPEQPSWGNAFTVALAVSMEQGRLSALGSEALRQLQKQDQAHPNFPWEFVVHAMQWTRRHAVDGLPASLLVSHAKGTRMFNWFLLRQVNQGLMPGAGDGACSLRRSWILLKLRAARPVYTNSQGLILDELRTRSLQYHAFCLYLLCELADQFPRVGFLRAWLLDGARCAAGHVLADGTALWLGRGQEQVFGYGALLYALEYVHRRVHPLSEEVMDRVQARLLSFQREDGSFPLVLRRPCGEPAQACFADRPAGWYGYNTLYDYLPFLAFMMVRASRLRCEEGV